MKSLSLSLCAAALALSSQIASAGPLSITWTDAVGDSSPVGDAAKARLVFDGSSGAWTATWWAAPAKPFTGNARFNLNLFDTALGNLAGATAPQLSLDGFHDFGGGSALEFSYSGNASFLANWHAGDTVSTGNGTNFISGLVNQNQPFGRDNLLTQAVIVNETPEPGALALALLSLGLLLGLPRLRRSKIR